MRGKKVALPPSAHLVMTTVPRFQAAPGARQPMLEREGETAAIDAAITRATAGAGTALVLVGEAGIGKSTLASYALGQAQRQGIRTLRARGAELERGLPYGVAIELLGATAHEADRPDELFAGQARIAAPLFGLHDGATPSPVGDPAAYLLGLFWMVLNLAERGPLAIVVDDAQWVDEPSLRLLHRLVQRVDELPVALLVTMRPEAGSPDSAAGTLLRAERSATFIEPQPLSEAAVGELMAQVADRDIATGLRESAWEATHGNPYFVTELAAELARLDRSSLQALDVETFVPERISRHVKATLAGADGQARRVAEAAAVLGECATLQRAATLADVGTGAAEAAVRWLVDAAILDGSPKLGFRHPIVRSAVDAGIPGPARAELRRRAGLLLADEDVDIGVVGTQLRDAAPAGDARVVRLLRGAADRASSRGEPRTAAALLRRALDEPPPADDRPEILAALARVEAAAGTPSAPETFARALALVHDPARRARLQLELGHALIGAGAWPAARDVFAQALATAGDLPEELRGRLEAGFLSAAWVSMEDRAAIGERVRHILEADRLGEANRELAAWIAFQQGAVVQSTAPEMADLVRRVLAEAPLEELVRQGQVVEISAGVLLETDELLLEIEVLTKAIDAARRTGPIGKAGVYAYCRAWPGYYSGRLTEAIADAEEALRAAELGWETFVPAAAAVAALSYIERNELDAAERVIALDPVRWAGRVDYTMLVPLATGRLALARGDVALAAERLQAAGSSAAETFMRNTVPTDWRTWYATALLRLDRRTEARAVAQEAVEITRMWGADWPRGAALRVAGLVEGGAAGIELLREAEALLRDSPARLEHARLLVTMGAVLRRHGSLTDARDVLYRAADLARRLGARALLERAMSELRAAGGRPRRIALTGLESLTPAELRVATLALEGRTNREIAQALFVTPKAIEFHLANSYRKLHITSRSELAAAMAGGAPGVPEGSS